MKPTILQRKVKFAKVVRRRRRPGEIPTMGTAIRNHCLECQGYDASGVADCRDPGCWLFPLRFGCYPEASRARGKPTDALETHQGASDDSLAAFVAQDDQWDGEGGK